jgi:uncharacterized UBP type Zn finger protein
MVHHMGKHAGHGHYVAYVRGSDGAWTKFNDRKVHAMGDVAPPTELAYLYIFRRA